MPVLATVESHFYDHPIIWGIISGLMRRRVLVLMSPKLGIGRHFGHDGGLSIDFVLVLLAL